MITAKFTVWVSGENDAAIDDAVKDFYRSPFVQVVALENFRNELNEAEGAA